MEERIRDIYNDCWANYKEYLSDHDMEAYNQRSHELQKKYGCMSDITNLLLWFSPKINAMHDEYTRRTQSARNKNNIV